MTAGHSGCAKTSDSFADFNVFDILANFNNRSGKLVAEGYGGEITKGIMQYVNVGAAYAAKGNLDFDTVVPTNGFGNISNTNIAFTWCVFH
jgi:hypothetical protein